MPIVKFRTLPSLLMPAYPPPDAGLSTKYHWYTKLVDIVNYLLKINTPVGGTYTPSLTTALNIVVGAIAYPATYIRVNNTVTVAGTFVATAIATGACEVQLGPNWDCYSNFTTVYQLGGTAVGLNTSVATVSATIQACAGTNGTASIKWVAVDTSSRTMTYTYTYTVV